MGFGKDLGRDDMYADRNLRNCVCKRTAGRRHSGLDGTRYLDAFKFFIYQPSHCFILSVDETFALGF